MIPYTTRVGFSSGTIQSAARRVQARRPGVAAWSGRVAGRLLADIAIIPWPRRRRRRMPGSDARAEATRSRSASGGARAAGGPQPRAAAERRPVRGVLRRAGAARGGHRGGRIAGRSIRTPWRWPRAASSRRARDPGALPRGERGRRDYRLSLPLVDDASRLRHDGCRARRRGRGSSRALALAAIPYSGPWTPGTLGGLFEAVGGPRAPGDARRQPRHPPPVGLARGAEELLDYLLDGRLDGPRARLGRRALRLPDRPPQRPRRKPVRRGRHLPLARAAAGIHLQPQERLAAAVERRDMPAGGIIAIVFAEDAPAVRSRRRARSACARARGTTAPPRRRCGGEREPSSSRSSAATSARSCGAARCSPPSSARGSSWASAGCPRTTRSRRSARSPSPTRSARPATCACCRIATPTCASRRRRSRRRAARSMLCDITETDGQPWECCPRQFLRDALARARRGARRCASWRASSTSSSSSPTRRSALPFSLEALRRAEPFAAELMGALLEAGVQPELLTSEFAAHQFEIPVEPAEGLAAARIAASCSRRSCASSPAATSCARASRRCSTPPTRATACTSTSACSTRAGVRALRRRPSGGPERARRALRGRDPAPRGGAQRADRSEPALGRAPCAPPLERRRRLPGRAQPRSAAAHPAAQSRSPAPSPRRQLRLEYRGADASRQPLPGARRDRARGARRRARAAARAADPRPSIRRPSTEDEAARYGVAALPASPRGLAAGARRGRHRSRVDAAAAVRGLRRRQARRARGGRGARPRRDVQALCRCLLTRCCERCSPASSASFPRPSRCAIGCTATRSSPTRRSRRPPPSRRSCRCRAPPSPGPGGSPAWAPPRAPRSPCGPSSTACPCASAPTPPSAPPAA